MEETTQRKVRSACDACHGLKMKCSGGDPCTGCARSKQTCLYSEPNRLGRPKGSKNRQRPQWSRQRGGSSRAISADKNRAGSFSRESVPSECPTTQGVPMEIEAALPSTGDTLDIFNEHHLAHASDSAFFSTAAMSDKSWEEPSDLFEGLDMEGGFRHDGSVFSVMPLGYEDEFRRAMQGVDLSFLETGHCVPQEPISAPPESARASKPVGQRRETTWDGCSCLDRQTRFLSDLKKIVGKYPLTPVPIILQATQDSKALWERLAHCGACRRDQDSVAVLILAMGLRNILQGLQCLILKQQPSSQMSSSAWTGGSSTASNSRSSSRSSLFDTMSVEGTDRRSHELTTNTIRVGSFEIPQDEQAFLTDVLIARALSKIKWTHDSMVDYIRRVHGSPFANLRPGEKRPIHFILEDLQNLIEATEASVRSIIHSG
ncbi:uncharacterized protein N7515_008724 [Penicillium bovifimosum]|uniref:Zn(2)-C6 fungal-type domain-containing protein n=1 Tax=Penicillium bovifimosum TaxID=126998 RepID=A0A9W9KWM9_9EURO|nr:uncharacterized protein N7515_008724 [Penicillium bovifimosum]KAJ5124899.1 hypothetical protein N7515_008724 [Penicillium bovifimosum]